MSSPNGLFLLRFGHRGRLGVVPALAVLLLLLLAAAGAPVPHEAFEGQWTLRKKQSSPLDSWDALSLDVEVDGSQVTIEHHWRSGRFSQTDSMTIETGGAASRVPVERWLDNRHLGISVRKNTTRRVRAEWIDDGRTLQVVSRFPVYTSQGKTPLRILSEYRLSPDRQSLSLLQLRSTRPKPIHYMFQRAEEENA